MLKRSLSLLVFVCGFAAAIGALPSVASAQYYQQIAPGNGPLYWDATSSNFTWDAATPEWNGGSTAWINDGTYDAQLADQTNAPGTITLDSAAPINVDNVYFGNWTGIPAGTGAPTGNYTVTGGTLNIGGMIMLHTQGTVVVNSTISGTNGVVFCQNWGGGMSNPTVVLGGANTYSGTNAAINGGGPLTPYAVNGTDIEGVTLVVANSAAIPTNGNVTVDTDWLGAGALAFGSGIAAGTIGGLSGGYCPGNPVWPLPAGNVNLTNSGGAAVTLTVGGGDASATFGGAVSGLGGLVKTGSGVQCFTGNITCNGLTTVSAGTLLAENTLLFGAGGGVSIAPGAALQFDFASGNLDPGASYTISGGGTLLKTGPGVIDLTNGWPIGLNNGAAVAISMGAGGLIDIEGGAIANKWVGVSWAGNQASVKIASGAVLDIGGNSGSTGVFIDALSGSGTVGNTSTAPNVFTLGVANGSGTFYGAIMGSGDGASNQTPGTGDPNTGVTSVTKTGTGIQVLAGNNAYTGVTTISGGTLQFGDGAANNGTVAGSIVDNSVLVFANPAAQSYAGAISGSGSVVKTGAGALTLSGGIRCNGATLISAGTLVAENTFLFGAGGASIAPGATLQFDFSSGNLDPGTSYTISGCGTLLKTGPGVIDLTNGYPDGNFVTISMGAGGLIDMEAGAIANKWLGASWAGNMASVKIAAGAVLDIGGNSGNSSVFIDALTGSGTVGNTSTAPNLLTLGVANGSGTFSGAIMGDGDGAGGQTPGTGDPNTGVVSVTKTGTGTQVLRGADTYSGPTTISGGILQFATPASLYNAAPGSWTAANITVNNAAILAVNLGGPNDFQPADVTNLLSGLDRAVSNNGLQAGSSIGFDTTNATLAATLSNNITDTTGPGGGAVGLAKLGPGTLILTGSNTYSGPTTVSGGTLQIGNGGSGEGLTSSITLSNNAAVAFNHNDPLSYGGAISGSGQLIKLGTGVLDLSGTSTYSGPTTISAGTVELDGNGENLPTATALTIASGGVLDLAGVPQTVGSLSGSPGAIITNHYSEYAAPTLTVAPSSGATTFAGNIIGNDALALSGGGELTLSGTNTYSGGTTVSGGTLEIAASSALAGSGLVTIAAGGRLVLGSGAGIGALLAASSPASSGAVALSAAASAPATMAPLGDTTENMGTLADAPPLSQGGSTTAVPEPGTVVLLIVGSVCFLAMRRAGPSRFRAACVSLPFPHRTAPFQAR